MGDYSPPPPPPTVVNTWNLLCGEMLHFYIMGVSEALTFCRVRHCMNIQ